MRLDKFVANNSDWSRSELKKLLKQKRILLDGLIASDGGVKVNASQANVYVDGVRLEAQAKLYFMLNKPSGVVCANSDSIHPVVMDLLSELPASSKNTLQVAGRLDIDTTGLVLITNDGAWNHAITSPNRHCLKSYRVNLAQAFQEASREHFSEGMLLQGESKKTRPASLETLDATHVRLLISEGRYHQVKRMFAHCGNRVIKLHRESIGPIKLDDSLKAGAYRPLTEAEIQWVNN